VTTSTSLYTPSLRYALPISDVSGRKPVTIVELDQDFCSLRYGVGACPAVLGEDSERKCFNTLRSCAVPAAYTRSTLTLRFTEARSEEHTSELQSRENLVCRL